jgi:predicted transcriptional regulator
MLEVIAKLNDDALMDYIYDPFSDTDELMHVGVGHDDNPPGRGSGRYGYGTGENPLQHEESLKARVAQMRKQGLTGGGDIAKALGYKSSGELRKALSIEDDRRKQAMMKTVPDMAQKGMTVKDISDKLGVSQTTIRKYLSDEQKVQVNKTNKVADSLREVVKAKRYVDVSEGVERAIGQNGCSKERLGTALKQLEDEGYHIHTVKVPQLGNPAQKTTVKVLGDKDTKWA